MVDVPKGFSMKVGGIDVVVTGATVRCDTCKFTLSVDAIPDTPGRRGGMKPPT